ncbi:MAG TPA: hypothetical protein VGI70_01315 [Polyangiales bacterium]|jgi:hypothetical protein
MEDKQDAALFHEALFIVEWDKDRKKKLVYRVEEEAWKNEKNLVTDDAVTAPLWPLVKKGVVFAAVPELDAEGSACYLVNLTMLDP